MTKLKRIEWHGGSSAHRRDERPAVRSDATHATRPATEQRPPRPGQPGPRAAQPPFDAFA